MPALTSSRLRTKLALLALAGWWFKVPALQSLSPGGPPMLPNAALVIILLALSLRLVLPKPGAAVDVRYQVGQILALLAASFGIIALVQEIFSGSLEFRFFDVGRAAFYFSERRQFSLRIFCWKALDAQRFDP